MSWFPSSTYGLVTAKKKKEKRKRNGVPACHVHEAVSQSRTASRSPRACHGKHRGSRTFAICCVPPFFTASIAYYVSYSITKQRCEKAIHATEITHAMTPHSRNASKSMVMCALDRQRPLRKLRAPAAICMYMLEEWGLQRTVGRHMVSSAVRRICRVRQRRGCHAASRLTR